MFKIVFNKKSFVVLYFTINSYMYETLLILRASFAVHVQTYCLCFQALNQRLRSSCRCVFRQSTSTQVMTTDLQSSSLRGCAASFSL